MSERYDSSAIEVLTGLDPVRRRPGMYTDTERPNHLAHEVIDNSVDEALAGHAKKIDVVLYADGSLAVADDGRGMPVDDHPETGRPGVEVILSKLHAGGKFSQKSYRFSGGLHGVGVSVVNALSASLEVWIKRDGGEYHIAFENGEKIGELEKIAKTGKKNTGTVLKFLPDKKFFENPAFDIQKLRHNLRSKAILCAGLHIRFDDQIHNTQDEWCFQNGLSDYLNIAFQAAECIPPVPFNHHFSSDDAHLDCAFLWTENAKAVAESYVNLIPTSGGGTHVNGLRSGITEALKEFCQFRNLVAKNIKLTPDDVWQKISYILSVKILEPQFSGQTKERLSSRECAAFVAGVVKDSFSLWLNQHIDFGEKIAALAIQNAHERMKSAKKITRKKITGGPALPGKLSDCTSADLARTELFLVEGDSAGGSAKQARDKDFQAILPLRGKILNTWESSAAEVLASNEIHDISVAVGLNPDDDADLSKLRYGKICILADADSDGAHIATLICALFVRHFRHLVAAGHIYVAVPPLYRIDAGAQIFYALDDDEKNRIIDKIEQQQKRTNIRVQRFKGLGEMNPSQLRETTMHPDTRRLIQLTLDDPLAVERAMDMLLAKKRAADRKMWLEREGDLAHV